METDTNNSAGMQSGPRTAITVTGSPFTYTNTSSRAQLVNVMGGTVTIIEYARNGFSFDVLGLLSGQYTLMPGDKLRVSYLVAPTMTSYDL